MLEIFLFIIILLITVIPVSILLGKFIAQNFNNHQDKEKTKTEKFFTFLENPIYKFCGINPEEQMTGKEYFLALFYTNIVISLFSFLILYFQTKLPFSGGISFNLDLSLIFHILSSLITNTCQTHHIPESQLTPLSNFFIMPLLMFYSSASGIATGVMFIRSISLGIIGNAYVDVIKSMTRILFPGSLLIAIIFAACGIPNTFTTSISYTTLEGGKEKILLGPIAAFEAIKLLGENGLSCFSANSGHPFENPSYFSNFLEIVIILIVPIALIISLGIWLKNYKQSITILSVLLLVLVFEFLLTGIQELKGNSFINQALEVNGANWVGKDTRFGIVGSSIFTAAVSNVSGSSNSSLDSFHPMAVSLALFNLSNQSIFGVQGFGTVFTINLILYTAFFIGLMIGKTPEIFGRKIEKNEIILSSILQLINPFLVLLGTLITVILFPEKASSLYEHIHYYTKVFFEFASGAASNGSGLEQLNDNTPYWNWSLAFVMFVARYIAMLSMILLGASLASKPKLQQTTITFKTDTPLFGFIYLLMSLTTTILIYLPFFILGPIAEIFIKK